MNNTIHFSLRHFVTLFLLFLCEIAGAQQNQKIVYPNPAGFLESQPSILLDNPDGGWVLAGTTLNATLSAYTQIPRVLKINAAGQTEWDRTYLTPTLPRGAYTSVTGLLNAPDGGWLMSVRDDSTGIDLIRIAAGGNQIWQKNLSVSPALLGAVNGIYYGYSQKFESGGYKWQIHQLGLDGTLLNTVTLPPVWSNTPSGNGICLTTNNELQLFVTQRVNNQFVSKLVRYSLTGTLIWEGQPLTYTQGSIQPAANGGILLLSAKNKLYRYDALGSFISTSAIQPIPDVVTFYSFVETLDGGILVGGQTNTQRGVMAKLGNDYSVQWVAEAPEDGQPAVKWLNSLPTSDGWGIGLGPTTTQQFAIVRVSANTGITVKTLNGRTASDANKNCIVEAGETGVNGTSVVAQAGSEVFTAFSDINGEYTLKLPPGNYTLGAKPVNQFFFTCAAANQVPVSLPVNQTNAVTVDFPIQSLEVIHQIKGTVRLDKNDNCTVENGDLPLKQRLVRITGSGFNVHTYTDADGRYVAWLPNGSYEIKAEPINNSFGVCSPATRTVGFQSAQAQTEQVDFLMNTAIDCAILKTFPSGNFVRPCSTATLSILYQNIGTINANSTQITVVLDPLLTYQSSSITPVGVNGNTLVFDVGTVAPGYDYSYKSFDIAVEGDCSLQIGQQVCVTSSIKSDDICFAGPNWNGAIVAVSGACNTAQNEAIFKIKNIGTAPNSQLLEYIVAEDQIVLRTGTFRLNPGDSLNVTVPYNGATQTIIAQQEPGFPGDTTVNYALTNCMGMGGSSGPTGFNGNAGPFTQQRCFMVRNSFDPNDKQAKPEGYGPNHIVWPGTPLEYKIRFQNTGNDTAFLVVIRDTLSVDLDPATIQVQAGSHPYRFDLLNNRILQFTFENILLPDSAKNEAASQGYVDFSIRPRRDLALGTKIGNRAAIYFDYNQPIITNTVWRTFDRYFKVTATENPAVWVPVKVFPNPAFESAALQLPDECANKNLQFVLTDALGRTLRQADFQGNRYVLQRETLSAGVYLWHITSGGQRIASGKVMMQ